VDNFAMVPLWLLEKRVSGNAVIVYALLASYGHFSTGDLKYIECRPAMSTLVKRAGLSEMTVRRAVDELMGVGALVRHRRTGPNGADVPSMYEVIFRRPVDNPQTPTPPPGDPSLTDEVPPPSPVRDNQEPDTQSSASLRSAGERLAPAAEKIETAQTILGDWIDYLDKTNVKLPSVHRARYGKEIKRLLDDGYGPRSIKLALAKMTADNAIHRPAMLAETIVKLQTGPEIRERPVTAEQATEQRQAAARARRRELIREHGKCPHHPDQPAGVEDNGNTHCYKCHLDNQHLPARPELVAEMNTLAANFGTR